MHQGKSVERTVLNLWLMMAFLLTIFPWNFVAAAGLETYSHKVPHTSLDPHYQKYGGDPNIELYLHEVVDKSMLPSAIEKGKIILLIHGATFPGTVAFDLQYDNVSVMRQLAGKGWNTFALDLEGYGQSPRPHVMDDPAKYPDDPAPITREVTIANVATAVDYIRELRAIDKIHLLGWSLGATIEVPRFTMENPDKVASISLYAPGYHGQKSEDEERNESVLEKWRQQKVRYGNPSKSMERFIEFGSPAENLVDGVFYVYATAHTASDPLAAELDGKIRAPWGRFSVLFSESPMFNASRITTPTLILRGENDPISSLEDMENLLSALGSESKSLVNIPNAGHMAHMEISNDLFYSELLGFLDKHIRQ